MKKFLYGALALASVASLASCSSDEPLGQQPNDGKVTFTVTMPGQNTRFADGKTVDQLYYTVFQNGTKVLEGVEDWPTGSLSTTVTLQLVSNQSYDVVFFADTKAAETAGVYTYKPATADFTVTYSDKMINNDAYDAFVKKEAIVADGGEKKVLLYRPFAQVNIGSDDLDNGAVTAYGLENFSSTLTIKPTNVLSGMNFFSGATTEQTAAVTFSLENFSNLPTDAFPVSGKYKYIGMNYLLVPVTPENAVEDWSNLLDVTYTINGKGENNVVNELNLSSMPTRQNYQTNVYGSLLTTQQAFNVEIKPAFTEPAYNMYISTPEEFLDAIKNGGNYTLANDIALPESYAAPAMGSVNINLNDHVLDLKENIMASYGTSSIKLTNGTVIGTNSNPFQVNHRQIENKDKKATLEFDGVFLNFPNAFSLINCYASSDLIMTNCKVVANGYIISTNASQPELEDHTFVIDGCDLTATAPIAVNVPCNLTMTNTKITGVEHAVMMRGGTAVIKDCELILNPANANRATLYYNTNWSSGNEVPNAVITLGNRSATAYRYPTNVTLENVSTTCAGDFGKDYANIYVWANPEASNGVTLTFDQATKQAMTGGTGLYVGNVNNVLINGVAPTKVGVQD